MNPYKWLNLTQIQFGISKESKHANTGLLALVGGLGARKDV